MFPRPYNPFSNSCSSAILKSAFLPKNHFIMSYWMDNWLKRVPWSVLKCLWAIKWYETLFLQKLNDFSAFWSNFAWKNSLYKGSLKESLISHLSTHVADSKMLFEAKNDYFDNPPQIQLSLIMLSKAIRVDFELTAPIFQNRLTFVEDLVEKCPL